MCVETGPMLQKRVPDCRFHLTSAQWAAESAAAFFRQEYGPGTAVVPGRSDMWQSWIQSLRRTARARNASEGTVCARQFRQCSYIRVVVAAAVVCQLWTVMCLNPVMAQDDTAPEPPAVSVDQVELRPVGLRRAKVLSGVIEDVIAESAVIRRTAGAPDVVPLRDVATLRFQKPVDYEAGLKLLQNYRWSEALPLITKALDEEQRPWVIREIRAARAEIFRAQRRYDDCIREVEQILDSDPDTRHLLLLPLVWDERLEESARYIGRAEDLQSDSECRRLVTATALLHESAHQQQAEAVLRDLKRNGRGSMGAIVELQLWRLSLLTTGAIRELAVEQWQVRLREFQRELRGPGEWICGRALMVLNDYDRALTALLWMPLVAPLDPASTAAAIQDAVVAAKQAGRPGEAAALALERELWLSRMGQASAAGDAAEERSGSAGEQRSAEK